jgi:hypothetical protein
VEFMESLPKTGTGKVLKRDLRKKYWQGRETIRPDFDAADRATGPNDGVGERNAWRASQNK